MTKEDFKSLSDEQLVLLSQQKDENAVEELFNRYKYIASAIAHAYFLNGGNGCAFVSATHYVVQRRLCDTRNYSQLIQRYLFFCAKLLYSYSACFSNSHSGTSFL